MKITRIYAENFLGMRSADVVLDRPVALFAGQNFAGKSSLQEAVRMALTGEAHRVHVKKEYGALVSEGEKNGFAEVSVATANGEAAASIVLPSGKATAGFAVPPALPYVLDAQRFPRMDAAARRTFLFGLMGIQVTAATVSQRMLAKGLDKAKVERVMPLLRGGFEVACADAKEKATQAKGAWRAITSETYGAVKAGTWEATKPEFDAAALAALQQQLRDADAAIEAASQKVGGLQADNRRFEDAKARAATLQAAVEKKPRIEAKLAADQPERQRWVAEVERLQAAAATAPRKGLVHDLAAGVAFLVALAQTSAEELAPHIAALAAYEAEFGPVGAGGADPAAAAALPAALASLELLRSAVANDERDLAAAERAANDLAGLQEALKPVAGDLDTAQQHLAASKVQRASIASKVQAGADAKKQAEAAAQRTTNAATHHADVLAWTAIADVLAPDGIPGEMLTEALTPINTRLAQSAVDAEWPKVVLDGDMHLTAGGRAYELLSESEKWRVDAMVAEAISFQSGVKCLVLDRFDVLDLKGRGDLLAWLHVLADGGEVDTALIFGTLKALPSGLPATVSAHWINIGRVGQQLKEAA